MRLLTWLVLLTTLALSGAAHAHKPDAETKVVRTQLDQMVGSYMFMHKPDTHVVPVVVFGTHNPSKVCQVNQSLTHLQIGEVSNTEGQVTHCNN